MDDLLEREKMHTGFWWGNEGQTDNLQDLSLDGNIILKLNVKKWDGGMEWIYLSQYRGRVVGSCKCGNEPPGSKICGGFLE